ncbi:hypothetical protein [Caballeronia novacaledonica]|uniref:Uncharacterized protein n=1 Tax=Caballeronia novacaledonica TaxID=1544861 RepID=A0AA37IAD9_9BURK|nr:hypothetical protein [Caballeronia novacaledonica]GJH26286.1 hypothetical protein CBA19CS42_17240 [Caballeronia novacaledonica]
MPTLVVSAQFRNVDSTFASFRVYAADGATIGSGAVAPQCPVEIALHYTTGPFLVRGKSDGGIEAQCESVDYDGNMKFACLVFSPPDKATEAREAGQTPELDGQDDFWLVAWAREARVWRPASVDTRRGVYGNEGIRTTNAAIYAYKHHDGLSVRVESSEPHLLQFGGRLTRWKLISLPENGGELEFSKDRANGEIKFRATTSVASSLVSMLRRGDLDGLEQVLTAPNLWKFFAYDYGNDGNFTATLERCLRRVRAYGYVWERARTRWHDLEAQEFGALPRELQVILALDAVERTGFKNAQTEGMISVILDGTYPCSKEGAKDIARLLRRRNMEYQEPYDDSHDGDSYHLDSGADMRALLCANVDGTDYFTFHGASPVRPTVCSILGTPEEPTISPIEQDNQLLSFPAPTVRSLSRTFGAEGDEVEPVHFIDANQTHELHRITEAIIASGGIIRLYPPFSPSV